MNMPLQSAPVSRGYVSAQQMDGLTQQRCGWRDWLACAGHVARCAGSCLPNPLNPGCAACLGGAYSRCSRCF
jgi:hypothetical protein